MDNRIDKRTFNRFGHRVVVETDIELKEQYPYYCHSCDENMFEFETTLERGVYDE